MASQKHLQPERSRKIGQCDGRKLSCSSSSIFTSSLSKFVYEMNNSTLRVQHHFMIVA
jgi:hypothetical protein